MVERTCEPQVPVRQELLDASDDTIDEALRYADSMTLRGVLYLLTGDEDVATATVGLTKRGLFDVPEVVDGQQVALLRRKAAEFLKAHRDAGAPEISIRSERLRTAVRLTMGLELADEDLELYVEELGLEVRSRRLEWKEAPLQERLETFTVIVIGTGMGGLTAALELKRAGIPFVLIEKNPGVGGTWYENRYPGARVDTPSRAYVNSFGVDFDFPDPYCSWTENLRYFNWVAERFGLQNDILFDTEARSLTWNENNDEWEVVVTGPEGSRTLRSRAVITAVGFLNRPNIPQIEGMSTFRGPSWHTAAWPEGFDPSGKTFAVIGTGCTGYQLVPELALQAEHVTVFQRTAQWLMGVRGYRSPFPPQVKWLDRNFPFFSNFARVRATTLALSFSVLSEIDDDFDSDPNACNPSNKQTRDACIAFLNSKLADPDLVARMTPPHPVLSARPVVCDPEYSVLDAIQRDDVTLANAGIRRINETGIEDGDGTQHDIDVIVYATGFRATEYLFPMTVTGRDGRTLEDLWADGGARAYVGSMLPGFPNLWMVYGPNTNGALAPATFHELVVLHALQCIERLILDNKREVEVKEEAYRRYNRLIDERNNRKVWSDVRAHNYYWSDRGRSATMNPLLPWEMYHWLRHPRFDDIEIR